MALIPGPLAFFAPSGLTLVAFILALYGIGISLIFDSPILCPCSARQLWKATLLSPPKAICDGSISFQAVPAPAWPRIRSPCAL